MGIYATFGISLRKYLSFGSALHVQSKSTQLFCYFEGPSKFIDQAAEFKVKSRSRFEPLLHIWPSLVRPLQNLKAIEVFDCKNYGSSFLNSALTQLQGVSESVTDWQSLLATSGSL